MADKVILAGFHAVLARLRLNPKTLREVYIDRSRHDRRMHELCVQLREAGLRPIESDAQRLRGLAGDVPHQGVAAVADRLERTMSFDELLDSISDETLLLILDGVTDPRNFGACLRVADAAGAQAVIAPLNRSSHVTPAAAKAAAGAEESVPVIYVVNLASAIGELREAGVTVVGTAGETERSIYDFDQKKAFAWVLGSEGEGLRQLTRRRCDALAAIPMKGSVESLNVSVAAGVCLFETLRQRLGGAPGKVDNASRAKF
ncbi:MAG: 23S rRNA (guanosine(2251)-2'-O)-methyltransferase RlmB [Mesosutterella sp.]|nr:23S rRNA (guanosine(2251)-2'-O)-methyltransferase RlmB [Mesosutterella sp.]